MGQARRKQRKHGSAVREWVGGQLLTPFYVTEGEPHRPELILWLELPEDLIVWSQVIDREAPPVSFRATLLEATRSPVVGPPRRPPRVRVADALLAAELRGAWPELEVVCGATPELDRLLERFASTMVEGETEEELSYFEGGRVAPEAVEALFCAAQIFYRVAPWKVAHDDQVLRLDIPALGVEGACVSILGALGESFGLVIFPSFTDFERFTEMMNNAVTTGPIDLGTRTLSLNFERATNLPPTLRREAAEHGWPVAASEAYPWAQHRDPDGTLRPLTAQDVRVVTACATSLAAFFVKHGSLFGREQVPPVCESFFDNDDLEVRFTLPYEAGSLFEVNDPPRSLRPAAAAGGKTGRNQPCPCGSGKKYKVCCLGKAEARAGGREPATVHELDRRLVEQMLRFGNRRFGAVFLQRAEEDFLDPKLCVQLLEPWAAYHLLVEGKPVAAWYLEAERPRLSRSELSWLAAQEHAWLSVWEVQAADPGRSLTLCDLLTGQERTVHEVIGSKGIARRDALLARIVDHEGVSVIGGSHPYPLPPVAAAEVVERLRKRLRRKREVPVDRLREEKTGRFLIACWDDVVEELFERHRTPPRLQNTDGDELLLTADHFELAEGQGAELERRLAGLEGAEAPEAKSKERVFRFVRPGKDMDESTLIGRAVIRDRALVLESNSRERADALRARVEAACAGLVAHRAREHTDPLAQLTAPERSGAQKQRPPELPTEEVDPGVKQKHYARWVDCALPALDGETPREAVRTRVGRARMDLLLRDLENHEARLPEGQRFDVSVLRRGLLPR